LRQEIADLKAGELKKKEKKQEYNPHFEEIDPIDLLNQDLTIYRKFKEKSLAKEEFMEYQSGFKLLSENKQNISRSYLMAFISNQLVKIENQEWFDPKNYKEMMKYYEMEKQE
jgi:hypothetical protein